MFEHAHIPPAISVMSFYLLLLIPIQNAIKDHTLRWHAFLVSFNLEQVPSLFLSFHETDFKKKKNLGQVSYKKFNNLALSDD